MRKILIITIIGILVLAAHGSILAQPLATIALPEPGGTEQLYPGCNPIALTFPDGTASQTVVQAVSPAGAVQALWSFNAASRGFEGFSPAAPQASDLLTVGYLDAVWICVAGEPPPPPTPPTATPIPSAPPLLETPCRSDPLLGTDFQPVSLIEECVTVTGTVSWIVQEVYEIPPNPPGYLWRYVEYTYVQIAADDGSSIVAVITPWDQGRLGFKALPGQWPVHDGDHVIATGALTFSGMSGAIQLHPCWQLERWP